MTDRVSGRTLQRAELARRTGCNLETIRYYEKTGMMPDPPRTASGYRVADYERGRAKAAPVIVEKLSHLTLDQQIGSDGATWLDRELVSSQPETTRDSGFGRDLREAQSRRRQWLIAEGLAREEQGSTIYRANMLTTLRRRELTRIAGQLSEQLGLAYADRVRWWKEPSVAQSNSPAANTPSSKNPASSPSSPGAPSSIAISISTSQASCAPTASPGP